MALVATFGCRLPPRLRYCIAVAAPSPLRIAVLGDVHGHLTLALRLLRRWQDETGHTLDLILQVGDLGAYPPPFRLDDATRRFAERDPDELGFAEYYEGGPEAAEVYGPEPSPPRAITAPFWFIKGNHEDFEFLDEVSRNASTPVPVAAFGAVHYLPSGGVYELSRRDLTIRIGVLGGISPIGRSAISEHYTAHEVRTLGRAPFDILLSHEPATGTASVVHPKYQGGSREVADLLHRHRPRLHFCGHLHEPGQQLPSPDGVRSYLLNAVSFLRANRLSPGCIALVSWTGPDDLDVELLDAPWLRDYTRHNWRHR